MDKAIRNLLLQGMQERVAALQQSLLEEWNKTRAWKFTTIYTRNHTFCAQRYRDGI
jgi:hypothetical protein